MQATNNANDPRRPSKVTRKPDGGSSTNLILNNDDIPNVDATTHLGIHRDSKAKLNKEDRINLGRRTAYSLLGAGFHGQNGLKQDFKAHIWNLYKAPVTNGPAEDPTPDYMNLLGMIFSMCGLMMKLKWCAWCAVYCSFISFANSRASEDTKQTLSSFLLSISAVVMSYLQNPQPMTPPWQ